MIKPEDIVKAKAKIIDPDVEKCVDLLIARNWDGRSSNFQQKELINLIMQQKGYQNQAADGYAETRKKLFDEHHLDFEPLYEEQGWSVSYDKPSYNETYEANWTFRKKDK